MRCAALLVALALTHVAASGAFTELWTDHVVWTRSFIVATLRREPDEASVASDRLMTNQDELGTVFFDQYSVPGVGELLREHITQAAQLVAAVRDGAPGEQIAALNATWYANGDALATSFAKGLGTFEEWRDTLTAHLQLTTRQVVLRARAQWLDDQRNFDAIMDHARTRLGKVMDRSEEESNKTAPKWLWIVFWVAIAVGVCVALTFIVRLCCDRKPGSFYDRVSTRG